jgi:hypothetical protein
MDFRDILRAKPPVAAHLKKYFAAFCRAAWPHRHPGAKLSWTPAHDLICEHLVGVWQGRTKRLIVNCPPRFAKSSIVTILFPVRVWLQDPRKAFLCCSYEIDLATNHNLDRRRLMDGTWFRDLFADAFTLSTDRSQAGDFQTSAAASCKRRRPIRSRKGAAAISSSQTIRFPLMQPLARPFGMKPIPGSSTSYRNG